MKRYWISVLMLFVFATAATAQITEADVRRAWREVVEVVGMGELPLNIERNDQPNAWVTAGERVTVTTKLMEILDSEDEIFGVLSHEAGHAYLDHHSGRTNNAVTVGVIGGLLSIFADKKIDNGLLRDLAKGGIALGEDAATSKYSRDQEQEADDFAVDVAFRGGRDPSGIYNAMERLSMYSAGAKVNNNFFGLDLNSHPDHATRLANIEHRIRSIDPTVRIRKVSDQMKANVKSRAEQRQADKNAQKGSVNDDLERLRREIRDKK